jgi:hypothetical protein
MPNKKINSWLLIILIITLNTAKSQDTARWLLGDDGSIKWEVKPGDTHLDHVEMSGFFISSIVHYGVEKGILKQKVELIFPMLRTIPNNTHASLIQAIDYDDFAPLKINGKQVLEQPNTFHLRGILSSISKTDNGVEIKHQLFPSTDQPIFIDKVEIRNTSNNVVEVFIPDINASFISEKEKSVSGPYLVRAKSNKNGTFAVSPKNTLTYSIIFSGRHLTDEAPYISADYELNKRLDFISRTFSDLVFESPNPTINRMFSFAKIRASESIYRTKGGLMHSPGGKVYYAAVWANDQAEYANPFFPYLGNLAGNESAINSFRHFARFMNDDFKPIPRSIIAEGIDIYWGQGDHGYDVVDGDRGDMAMIAYGASRFALAYGLENTARELWPLIEWCLEYCKRKLNSSGVVMSNTDELEGRIPAGEANLNTSSLYFDALNSAYFLAKELRFDKNIQESYKQQAANMKLSIEKYFGANVQGYDTYRYYDGNDLLRAWISAPLTMGIFNRAKGTVDALFSDKLWTNDGLASVSGSEVYWDRATLYGLRGVIAAGETERGLAYLDYYSKRRLIGEHVPYPVEAYPEGNQRHLSAESALYCRVITEGLFGIRPTGFKTFSFSPKLPSEWNSMALKNIKAFDCQFNILVNRKGKQLSVKVFNDEKVFLDVSITNGESIDCQL